MTINVGGFLMVVMKDGQEGLVASNLEETVRKG